MSSHPQVSIVIPTRDRWRLLSAHALRSALGQVDVDMEVIVVDDGSTDETIEALARKSDARLRVLRNERAPGPSGARNTGIAQARGAWLAFLDDDDLWSPMKIRTQLAEIGSEQWGFAGVIVVDDALDPLYMLPLPDSAGLVEALMLGNIVPGGSSNVIAETGLVRELGGFDEQLSHSTDWDLWLRLARAGAPAVSSQILVATLEHARRMIFRDRSDVEAESKHLFDKHGGADRRQQLAVAEWVASEHRSAGHHLRAGMAYGRAGIRFRSPGNVAAALGALFGEPGLRTVSRLLVRTRGASHLEGDRRPVEVFPDWLQKYRTSSVSHA
jgi:glycosyltransferase involved in cell wall biosynthesis